MTKADITLINTKKVAQLANLTISEKEHEELQSQLNDVISYIRKLNTIDTSNTEPTAQVTGLKNRLRNGNYTDDTLSQTDATSGAKKTHNALFVVKKLVETS